MELTKSREDRETVRLNIGGNIFKCYTNTLKAYPESKLARLDKHIDDYDFEQNEYFFDRNPALFSHVLDSFRKEGVHLPKDVCGTTFKKELDFWEISPHYVAPCCWEALYRSEDDTKTMESLMRNENDNMESDMDVTVQEKPGFRNKLWRFLDEPSSSKFAQVWSTFMSFLVVAATFTDALATVPTFQQNFTKSEIHALSKLSDVFSDDNKTLAVITSKKPQDFIMNIITVCHIFLTLEFVLCFIVCENKKAYMICFTRFFTFLGYLAFWITFTIYSNLEHMNSAYAVNAYFLFAYAQLFKLARLFYFTKRTPAFKVMRLTFRASLEEFKILVFLLGIVVTLFGYFMYAAELFQNPKLSNAFAAIYWALITVTTVGYGDYTPETAVGHVIAGACAVVGVLVLALPVGIIASNFYKFYNYYGYIQNHLQNLRKYRSLKSEVSIQRSGGNFEE